MKERENKILLAKYDNYHKCESDVLASEQMTRLIDKMLVRAQESLYWPCFVRSPLLSKPSQFYLRELVTKRLADNKYSE